MKFRFLLPLVLAAGLAGCQYFQAANFAFSLNAPNPITAKVVYDARVAYDAAEVAAIHYVRLPLCTRHVAPCSEASVSAKLKAAGPIARNALNRAAVFAHDYPVLTTPELIREGTDIYNQYIAAAATFNALETANGVK
jgi:hypothetical protein